MNGSSPTQPLEHFAKRVLDEMETMAHREPAKAALAALGLGVALQVLPTRALVSGVTTLGVALLRPVVLTLGVVKMLELCRSQNLRIP
jgi:hypothetical protein